MDRRHGSVCHPLRRSFSRISAMMKSAGQPGIADGTMIAWLAPSPSSPAPSARRYAALGLDRSLRPSKLADRAARRLVLDVSKCKSAFTEIPYTKLLTFPCHPDPPSQNACAVAAARQIGIGV